MTRSNRPKSPRLPAPESSKAQLVSVGRTSELVQGGGGASGQDRNYYYYFLQGE